MDSLNTIGNSWSSVGSTFETSEETSDLEENLSYREGRLRAQCIVASPGNHTHYKFFKYICPLIILLGQSIREFPSILSSSKIEFADKDTLQNICVTNKKNPFVPPVRSHTTCVVNANTFLRQRVGVRIESEFQKIAKEKSRHRKLHFSTSSNKSGEKKIERGCFNAPSIFISRQTFVNNKRLRKPF
ncbi:hypothetical protein TNCV_1039441 [Trichonephila clavipes]|uniref:Uncharacterized protein n=1 Tax=Trichonephila clavipes TaxID=2585209 RepID=A0A8X6VWB4_TRICX|nr:hypothetical protein TNCV_1039441 [Trichonephila clavipes]